ncbi:MAG: Eco29kI family restriction endonuclease [Anaerolineae bacterium]|nr:Eco29kI family restriction endonuclease [Anaerolineae bacterium]
MRFEEHIFHSPQFESVVKSAVDFFNNTPVCAIPPLDSFMGGGVYALYYTGNYKAYVEAGVTSENNYLNPIYVGKAVPRGWRTARLTDLEAPVLYTRLREHAKSIELAQNLLLKNFCCRFMLMEEPESDLIVPVEAALIRNYRPLWNTLVDGFGNHDPGKGRYNQSKSEWDVLHPGRPWADRLTGISPKLEAIIEKITTIKM